MEILLYLSVFFYLLAWGFAFHVMYRGPGWRKQGTFGVAVCVLLQSMSIAISALTIVHIHSALRLGCVKPVITTVRVLLPSSPSAVRAGPPDHPAPLDAVLGGDLLLAVEAVRPVLVVLIEVLGSQFQAVGASGH